jgi:hypothetical protein
MKYIMKYSNAIKELLPTSKFSLTGSDENSIQIINWENEELNKPTHEEIKNKINEIETREIQEKQDAITKKASGKQKLLDLGLTEAEVKALIGI